MYSTENLQPETENHINMHTITESEIWTVLESVKDPEIPVLSVVDMGIITKVSCLTSHVSRLASPSPLHSLTPQNRHWHAFGNIPDIPIS